MAAAVLAVGLLVMFAWARHGGNSPRADSAAASFVEGKFELKEKGQAVVSGIGSVAAVIRATFHPPASMDLGSFDAACRMGSRQRCPVKDMEEGQITAVFPGSGTRCISNSSAPEYLFQVIPGGSKKLLLYFQGGGACWDAETTEMNACTKAVPELRGKGIFDRAEPDNPFRTYTIVSIGYCSGDAHLGDVRRPWGEDIEQRGYRNARAAVDWAKANFADEELESLILAGSSAGALGVKIWAAKLLEEFAYSDAAVIADSYAGVFPHGVQGPVNLESGLCGTGLLRGPLLRSCLAGTLTVHEAFEDAMARFPTVTFASVESKVDVVQIAFYQLVHLTMFKSTDLSMPQRRFTTEVGTIFRRYAQKRNWVSYLVNSAHHIFLTSSCLYSTYPGSADGVKVSGTLKKALECMGVTPTGRDTPLAQWLAGIPVKEGRLQRSECRGVVQMPPKPGTGMARLICRLGAATGVLAKEAADFMGLGSCDPAQAEKVFDRRRIGASTLDGSLGGKAVA